MIRRSKALIRIDRLYSKGITLVERDVKAIDNLSKYGEKLSGGVAKDLRDYLKLLGEMKEVQEKIQEQRLAKYKTSAGAAPEEELLRLASGAGEEI